MVSRRKPHSPVSRLVRRTISKKRSTSSVLEALRAHALELYRLRYRSPVCAGLGCMVQELVLVLEWLASYRPRNEVVSPASSLFPQVSLQYRGPHPMVEAMFADFDSYASFPLRKLVRAMISRLRQDRRDLDYMIYHDKLYQALFRCVDAAVHLDLSLGAVLNPS